MAEALKFGRNKRFRIMLASDIHLIENVDNRHDMDIISDYLILQNRALTTLKPNLVVLMGDNVSADNPESYKKLVSIILSPFIARQTPVAVVFGREEGKCNVPRNEQIKIWQSFDICHMLDDSSYSDDMGDYNLLVRDYEDKNDILNLWFMDMSRKAEGTSSHTPYATKAQIQWYEESEKQIRENHDGRQIPALVFQHVAVPEIYKLLKQGSSHHIRSVRGTDGDRKNYYLPNKDTDIVGHLGEAPHIPSYNSGQFESWKKTGDVFGAFFGCDHMNDFSGTVDGIVMGQCKLAGFGPYGDGLQQGVRIVDVYEDSPNTLKTRMCYYRELIGTDSTSVKGTKKWFRDYASVTFFRCLKLAGVSLAVFGIVKLTKKHTEDKIFKLLDALK